MKPRYRICNCRSTGQTGPHLAQVLNDERKGYYLGSPEHQKLLAERVLVATDIIDDRKASGS